MYMRTLFISVVLFVFATGLVAQQTEITGFYLEKIEEIGRWDSIMSEKLKLPAYQTVFLKNLSSAELEQTLRKDPLVQLLDVRTEAEYVEGHIKGAVLIDVKRDDFVENAELLLDKQKPVAVYCKGGVRSRRAAEMLVFRGFRVYNLDKGYVQWQKDGEAVESR